MVEIAVIGGSGFYELKLLRKAKGKVIRTPYGRAPEIFVGELAGRSVAFVARHGKGHELPPHAVNYRANIWALHKLGVKRILAVGAAGSANPLMKPGDLVVLDQFMDFTKRRPSTFFDGGKRGVAHVDMTQPYCPELREAVVKAAGKLGIKIHSKGVYLCSEGPRFETSAEIRAMRKLGADVIGMTQLPECVLAREMKTCYAAISVVTNFAAGISRRKLTHQEVVQLMKEKLGLMGKLITTVVPLIPKTRDCPCSRALQGAIA
jgi:5'-methylthioadenosine phosphorylase